jgi:hypothetical protein
MRPFRLGTAAAVELNRGGHQLVQTVLEAGSGALGGEPSALPSAGIADTDMPEISVHADFGLEWWCLIAAAVTPEVCGQSERGFENQRYFV